MVKFLIQRPVAVFMATLAFLLLGIVASLKIPTSLMPDIDIPKITVQLTYPNNTARELETNIVRPLRHHLLQIGNLKDIETETRDGFSTLELLFEYGTNIDYAFIETNEKVDGALNNLPRDLDRPKVIKASVTDIPVVYLTVSLRGHYSEKRFMELSEFTETVVKKRLEQLPDVAVADISGQVQGEIVIVPNREKLQSLGITNNNLVEAVQQNNFELGNFIAQNGIYQYNFIFSNPLQSKKDIEAIYLSLKGRLFQIKDLANVSLQPQMDRGLVYQNGKRALVLYIIKQADARMYELKESLEQLTNAFQKDYPNIEFTTHQDQSKLLKLSIDNLKSSLLIGSFLAILIMFLFIKDIKSPLIIGVSIPLSLIISILLMYLFGLSINIISLSGLILGVGMMIDNAIIVIDNISQKLELKQNIVNACIEGTNEIITPLISSVLTTCSVFLPLLFLSGITGALFYDQAIAVSIGLGSSLLISILVIPVLYKQLNQKKTGKYLLLESKKNIFENWYEKGYVYFFRKKWIVYGIALLGIVLALLFFKIMKYSQLPIINENETMLALDWNENITVKENQHRINTVLKDIPNLEFFFSQVGEQQFLLQREDTKSFSEATIYLQCNSLKELEKSKNTITKKIQQQYPMGAFTFFPPKNIFEYIFSTNTNKLFAEIYTLASLEVPNKEKLHDIYSLLEGVNTSKIPLKQTASIQILQEEILRYDVNYEDLVSELKMAFRQNFINNLKTAQKFIPIKLNYDAIAFDKIIGELFVKNTNQLDIPVRQLIKINPDIQYKTITANRNGEYLGFKIDSKDETIEQNIKHLKNNFRSQNNLSIRFSGSWLSVKKLNKELLIVILIAVLLLYLIMAAQFESFWQPLIILLEIPIDIGGALLVLWLFGGTINVMAAIGIIVMSGVIVNDSILKIHTINLLRKQGLSIKEAIKQGGKLRLKPILMTSLTTILALTPFLFIDGLGAELQRPLALTVIGGMGIGTFISLYFIPLVYAAFSKKE